MKKYAKSIKCYCCGPPYERCELCVPTSKQKKQTRRQHRQKLKQELKKLPVRSSFAVFLADFKVSRR